MSEPYIGQIIMFPGNFAPVGWAFCAGQILQASTNEALCTLLGSTYGGDGFNTVGLPDLRGRVPIHYSGTYPLGKPGGEAQVALAAGMLPSHSHTLYASTNAANAQAPLYDAAMLATVVNSPSSADVFIYSPVGSLVAMAASSITPTDGSSGAHESRQPYQVVNYIIALAGIFPKQN